MWFGLSGSRELTPRVLPTISNQCVVIVISLYLSMCPLYKSPWDTHPDRRPHSRGSSPGWRRRPGRSSTGRRSGPPSSPHWCRTGPGRSSTGPRPGSPPGPGRHGTQTHWDTATWRSRCASSNNLNPASRPPPAAATAPLSLSVWGYPPCREDPWCCGMVICGQQHRNIQGTRTLISQMEVMHVSTLHLLKEQVPRARTRTGGPPSWSQWDCVRPAQVFIRYDQHERKLIHTS